jgi:hypothetical protein
MRIYVGFSQIFCNLGECKKKKEKEIGCMNGRESYTVF